MKKVILILLLILSTSNAKMFQTVNVDQGTFIQKNDSKHSCANCGMSLPMFYKTNHIHNNKQYCSLHCLVQADAKYLAKGVKVVDTINLKFIDAQKAFYVVGSKQRGTMSDTSKYAFSSKEDALKFQKEYLGNILNYEEACQIAKQD